MFSKPPSPQSFTLQVALDPGLGFCPSSTLLPLQKGHESYSMRSGISQSTPVLRAWEHVTVSKHTHFSSGSPSEAATICGPGSTCRV
jgi:hypothetical protein